MKIILSLLAALVICSCANDKKETATVEKPAVAVDSTLVTDSSWGLVTEQTDLAGLKSIFGDANVKDERICGAECIDSVDVTILHTGTPKEVIIYWKDSLYHKSIGSMETRMPDAPYHTASGLKVGSTMQELLKQNGQPINFSGFGWDYGGYIQSFNKGLLERSRVHFRLDLMEGPFDTNELLGDVELNTNMPAVKKALDRIQVYQLSLSFYKDGQ